MSFHETLMYGFAGVGITILISCGLAAFIIVKAFKPHGTR